MSSALTHAAPLRAEPRQNRVNSGNTGGLMLFVAARMAAASIIASVASIVATVDVSPPAVSDAVLIALITSITTLLVAIVTLGVSIVNSRHLATQAKTLDTVGKNVNGKLADLLEARTGQAKAEGIIEGGDKADAKAAAIPQPPTEPKP